MSSAALAIIGMIWLTGGVLGAIAYQRMGGAEKPELKWPFPFFKQLYNRQIHALAIAVCLLGGAILIILAVIA
jgi:hypothetical protein